MAGLPGNFANIFVYNYNYPDGLEIGDRIASITGTIGEFVGDTQISFPGWTRKDVPTALAGRPGAGGDHQRHLRRLPARASTASSAARTPPTWPWSPWSRAW